MGIKIGQTVYYVARSWTKADCPLCNGKGTIVIRPKHKKYVIVCPLCNETHKHDMRLNYFQVFQGTVTRIDIKECITKKGHVKCVEYSGKVKDYYFSGQEIVFASKRKALKKAEELNKEFINKES